MEMLIINEIIFITLDNDDDDDYYLKSLLVLLLLLLILLQHTFKTTQSLHLGIVDFYRCCLVSVFKEQCCLLLLNFVK